MLTNLQALLSLQSLIIQGGDLKYVVVGIFEVSYLTCFADAKNLLPASDMVFAILLSTDAQ